MGPISASPEPATTAKSATTDIFLITTGEFMADPFPLTVSCSRLSARNSAQACQITGDRFPIGRRQALHQRRHLRVVRAVARSKRGHCIEKVGRRLTGEPWRPTGGAGWALEVSIVASLAGGDGSRRRRRCHPWLPGPRGGAEIIGDLVDLSFAQTLCNRRHDLAGAIAAPVVAQLPSDICGLLAEMIGTMRSAGRPFRPWQGPEWAPAAKPARRGPPAPAPSPGTRPAMSSPGRARGAGGQPVAFGHERDPRRAAEPRSGSSGLLRGRDALPGPAAPQRAGRGQRHQIALLSPAFSATVVKVTAPPGPAAATALRAKRPTTAPPARR
jgi:hypothetical protein